MTFHQEFGVSFLTLNLNNLSSSRSDEDVSELFIDGNNFGIVWFVKFFEIYGLLNDHLVTPKNDDSIRVAWDDAAILSLADWNDCFGMLFEDFGTRVAFPKSEKTVLHWNNTFVVFQDSYRIAWLGRSFSKNTLFTGKFS